MLDHALMTYVLNLTHKTNEYKMILTEKAQSPIVSANGKLAFVKEEQSYYKNTKFKNAHFVYNRAIMVDTKENDY